MEICHWVLTEKEFNRYEAKCGFWTEFTLPSYVKKSKTKVCPICNKIVIIGGVNEII